MVRALAHVLPEGAGERRGHLIIGGCDVVELADEFGTPLVIFDERQIRDRARRYRTALEQHAPGGTVIYASKAYSGLTALRLLHEEGVEVDVASGGELFAALQAGFPPERIHMHGNNKDAREISEALDAGVGTIVIDGAQEIDLVDGIAAELGVRQRVMLRLTPGVDPNTHHAIATGQVDSKFGFPLRDGIAERAVAAVRAAPNLELIGVDAHLGSQLLDLSVFAPAARVLADFVASVGGDDLTHLDIGGGLGIAYTRGDRPPSIEEFCRTVATAVGEAWAEKGMPMPRLHIEPGRSMVGRAGVTLYRVGGVKEIPGVRTYVSVDGGMSDQMRPMLYGAVYEPLIANRVTAPHTDTVRLVGKHCESGDVLVADAMLADPRVGDLVCLPATGAYGVAMANNYNGQPRPAVVMVQDGAARLVTRRETYEDLISREIPVA